MRGGRETDLGACAGAQGERGFVSGEKKIQDAFVHAFFVFFFYCCFHRNDIFILRSSRWLVSSRLSVTTPGDEKRKACQYRVFDPCAVHSPFDHVIAGSYKEGLPNHGESEMYVGDNRPAFLVKYAANAFIGKACYRDT